MKRDAGKFLYFFKTAILFVFLVINICFCPAAKAKDEFVIRQVIPDKAGKLILVRGNGNQEFGYKTIRLSNPDRLVIDVDNAILAGQKKNLKINNENFKDLRVAQFSVEPSQVRMVLTSDSADPFKNVKISKSKNTLLVDLNEITPSNIPNAPLYNEHDAEQEAEVNKPENLTTPIKLDSDNNAEKTNNEKEAIIKSLQNKIEHNIVLKNLKHQGNRVIISGTGLLSLTEPMILEHPKRIAFDITDCTLNSSEFLQPINLKNGDFVRIGQFDNNTVRVVVDTKNPELYRTVISPDMQSLIIAPENEVSFLEFPDSESIAEVQNIKVIKVDNKTTKILLTSAKPLIHNLNHYKNPNEILNLEIYNLKRPGNDLIKNLPKTGQFQGISFERIEKHPNGSRWIIPLNRTTKIQSKLSLDGRKLELTFQDVIPVISPTYAKAKSRSQVVLDAGHGGQEPGALRVGIYEKNITIDLTQRVKAYLQRAGVSVTMTREGDETVSLKQRTDITNSENPEAFVSIHINSSENASVRGLETYYYTPQSKELAQSVHTKIVNYVNSPDRGIRTARFYVIRNTEVPAILVEVGYMSNEAERNSILSEARKDATAKAIAEGIINYLKSKR